MDIALPMIREGESVGVCESVGIREHGTSFSHTQTHTAQVGGAGGDGYGAACD